VFLLDASLYFMVFVYLSFVCSAMCGVLVSYNLVCNVVVIYGFEVLRCGNCVEIRVLSFLEMGVGRGVLQFWGV